MTNPLGTYLAQTVVDDRLRRAEQASLARSAAPARTVRPTSRSARLRASMLFALTRKSAPQLDQRRPARPATTPARWCGARPGATSAPGGS
jgi:hypothetical protein